MTAFKSLLGQAANFTTTLRAAEIVAATEVTVLILGESGSGKELLARAIHDSSNRANQNFISINCAAIPEQLAESELFGHRKGAFSGASQNQIGKLQLANSGTLFLDEIGELPLAIQAKLLRFLENGECQPLGQAHSEIINTRIIAATNRDLYHGVQQGNFRQDLYYRLNIVPLTLPPLRERVEDISLLIQALTNKLAIRHNLPAPTYSKACLNKLKKYSWPGNIRELRNFCERMLILMPQQIIQPHNLPPELHELNPYQTSTFVLPQGGVNLYALERDIIQQALQQAYGNYTHAAQLLGLSRDTLRYRMKKYAIEFD
jgi:two-component system, NtrC family, response regulator HydG